MVRFGRLQWDVSLLIQNVLVHFGRSHLLTQNVLVHFGRSQLILLEFVAVVTVVWKNVLVYFWRSQLLNVLQHTPAMKHWL